MSTISATDYNQLAVDLTEVWGVGYGDEGYGQDTTSLAPLDPAATVDQSLWDNLISITNQALTHQGNQTITPDDLATGETGWFEPGTNVAYRIVWGYKDENQNLVLGPPSDRIEVSNTLTESRNVRITIQIPYGVDESWFYQIYRSPMSSNIDTTPSDDLQQVYESNPGPSEMTAREITVVDIVPDTLKQASLYTNVTQEGIASSNWQPPFAKDACVFKNHAFYANTRTQHRKYFNLISVAGDNGLQLEDTVTVVDNAGGSVTVIAKSVENTSLGHFKLTTNLTPAENIDLTARSLVNTLNKYSTNTFINAFYTSGYEELPGQMMFEKRTINAEAFYINSSRQSCWTPRLPSSGNEVSSTNDNLPNRIYISKQQQPEAVPLLNYIDIGSSNEPIERILTLRDGIVVLKTDGIYRISGSTIGSFQVSLIDSTVRILAKESAVVLSNRVFFHSDQGIVAVSDSGAQVISRPIENLLSPYSSTLSYPNYAKEAFGISYESDRKYILFVPGTGTDTFARRAFVYNIFTNAWTTWIKEANCGIVNPADNKLYLGCPSKIGNILSHVKVERKDFTSTDYVDESYNVVITNINGLDITVDNSVNLKDGDLLKQNGFSSVITNKVGNVITVTADPGFVTGDAKVYRPIDVKFTFDNIDGGNPGVMKHFRRVSYFFNDAAFDELHSIFESDLSSEVGELLLSRERKNTWGSGEWGDIVWGGGQAVLERVEAIVPQTNQRANWLNITISLNEAFSVVALNGISLQFHAMGERFK